MDPSGNRRGKNMWAYQPGSHSQRVTYYACTVWTLFRVLRMCLSCITVARLKMYHGRALENVGVGMIGMLLLYFYYFEVL